jgi:hypothetical protein
LSFIADLQVGTEVGVTADNPPMDAELRRHTRDRADTKLMLPTELLEQIHFGFPVHKRPPDPVAGTVR